MLPRSTAHCTLRHKGPALCCFMPPLTSSLQALLKSFWYLFSCRQRMMRASPCGTSLQYTCSTRRDVIVTGTPSLPPSCVSKCVQRDAAWCARFGRRGSHDAEERAHAHLDLRGAGLLHGVLEVDVLAEAHLQAKQTQQERSWRVLSRAARQAASPKCAQRQRPHLLVEQHGAALAGQPVAHLHQAPDDARRALRKKADGKPALAATSVGAPLHRPCHRGGKDAQALPLASKYTSMHARASAASLRARRWLRETCVCATHGRHIGAVALPVGVARLGQRHVKADVLGGQLLVLAHLLAQHAHSTLSARCNPSLSRNRSSWRERCKSEAGNALATRTRRALKQGEEDVWEARGRRAPHLLLAHGVGDLVDVVLQAPDHGAVVLLDRVHVLRGCSSSGAHMPLTRPAAERVIHAHPEKWASAAKERTKRTQSTVHSRHTRRCDAERTPRESAPGARAARRRCAALTPK